MVVSKLLEIILAIIYDTYPYINKWYDTLYRLPKISSYYTDFTNKNGLPIPIANNIIR